MAIIIWHTQVIIGHGNLTPSCLTRGSTGSLQFTGQWRQYNRVGALEIDANNNLKQTTFVTGLEHCGPAWQPLEIATLFLSLAGLHKLEVELDIIKIMIMYPPLYTTIFIYIRMASQARVEDLVPTMPCHHICRYHHLQDH